MKLKKIEIANPLKEKLSDIQAAGIAYQLRTECRCDCEVIRAILRPWLVSWKETSGYTHDDSHIGEDGVIWASMNWNSNTEAQFIFGEGAPGLDEIRWLIDKLTDCKIAAQTVNTRESYTGDSIDYRALKILARPPSTALIYLAMKALKQSRVYFENMGDMAQEAWISLDGECPLTR